MKALFSVPPQELHQFLLRIDLISIAFEQETDEVNDGAFELNKFASRQHRKYVMAVDGKLRSFFVSLDSIG